MNSQTIFAKLRDALAHLYPTTESARRIADDAGLDARQIRFSPQALENWHAILGAAVQAGKVDALLHIVVAEYASNSDLLAAYGLYRHFIEQGGRIAAPEPIYGDQGNKAAIGVQIGVSAKNVNIARIITQTTIEGNVNTGGGDVVGRDKVTIGTIINNLFGESLSEMRKSRYRQAMLKLVYNTWIKDVLNRSLYNEVLIDLEIEDTPSKVYHPWDMLLQIPERLNRPLPKGTKISEVFNNVNQSLLILGDPGFGKTTILLELANELIIAAEQDGSQPIPVVLNLSSWSEKRQPMEQWIVQELKTKYYVPQRISQIWIQNESLALLLDGLDEVRKQYQNDCVLAINQFLEEHMISLAVCSRTAEYEILKSQLRLQGAVVLRPLNYLQIIDYLEKLGPKFLPLKSVVDNNVALQDLVKSPLMFNIIILAYNGVTLPRLDLLNLEDQPKNYYVILLNIYIQQMFQRRSVKQPYNSKQIILWLKWLAQRMADNGQTVFFLDQIQPNWLPAGIYQKAYNISFILMQQHKHLNLKLR
jgi:DNA polymerase III delta prime subunit